VGLLTGLGGFGVGLGDLLGLGLPDRPSWAAIGPEGVYPALEVGDSPNVLGEAWQ
jgi:hypothetical protein